MSGRSDGLVLAIVLLALVALGLSAVCSFGLAAVAAHSASRAELLARLDHAARAAAADPSSIAEPRVLDPLVPLVEMHGPDAHGIVTRIEVEALAAARVHVRTSARHTPTGALARAASLYRTVDQNRLRASFPAALNLHEPASPLMVSPAAEACVDELPLVPAALRSPVDTLPFQTDMPGWETPDAISGELLLDTSVLADCSPACRMLHVTGPLRVRGSGAGTLIVDGDLHLEADARFNGALVVRGTVHVGPGAQINGAVRAARAAGEGSVTPDPCVLAEALAAPALRFPRPATPRWRLPVF